MNNSTVNRKKKIKNIVTQEKEIMRMILTILENMLRKKVKPSEKLYKTVNSLANTMIILLDKNLYKNLYKNSFYLDYITSKLKSISSLLKKLNSTNNSSMSRRFTAYILKETLMLNNFLSLVKNSSLRFNKL